MILITVTKPRKKLGMLLKLALVLILLALIVPTLYGMIVEVNALEQYGEAESEQYPGEPIRVNAELTSGVSGYWEDIAIMLYGE